MLTKFMLWGIVFSGLAVAFGAFGAHLIQPALAELDPVPKAVPPMEIYKTAVEYQFFHGLALIITGFLYKQRNSQMVKNAGILFILGIPMFSGSLYAMVLGKLMHNDLDFLGPITPLGGISFLLGWILLAIAFSTKVHTSRS